MVATRKAQSFNSSYSQVGGAEEIWRLEEEANTRAAEEADDVHSEAQQLEAFVPLTMNDGSHLNITLVDKEKEESESKNRLSTVEHPVK